MNQTQSTYNLINYWLRRIAKLEMLDEVEELELVLDHYAITWGVKLPNATYADAKEWEDWVLVPPPKVSEANDEDDEDEV